MAVKEILQAGNPILKSENKLIKDFSSEELKTIIQDMTDTMLDAELIGLAAPQIGYNFQIFITNPRVTKYRTLDQADILRVFINPKIIFTSNEKVTAYEGCGCVNDADQFGPVERAKIVTVEACDISQKLFNFKCDGILARLVQHEVDHLNGLEFVDRISKGVELIKTDKFINEIKNSENQKSTSIITLKEFEYL